MLAAPNRLTSQGKRDAAILHLMAYTGARRVELHRANLADVRTQNGRLTVAVQSKGRAESDELIVIAHVEAESALYDGLAVRGRCLRVWVTGAMGAAGVDR